MKKIAIIFPENEYNADRPLLYYSAKVFGQYGYEIVYADYSDVDSDLLTYCISNIDTVSTKMYHDSLVAFLADAVKQVEKQLEGIDFAEYDSIAMIGKGVGSAVGNAFMSKNGVKAMSIMITPIEQSFQLITSKEGIAFLGALDPLAECSKIEAECSKRDIEYYIFESANHSLETGNVSVDMKRLVWFTDLLVEYIETNHIGVYDFTVMGRNDDRIDLARYRGKVALVVNTATGCGFTPQYEMLEQWQRDYQDKGFTILDFPCNQFSMQAPGSSEEIHSFCTSRYDISFPQFAKIHVNGDNACELYSYLKKRKGFHGFDLSTPDGRFLDRKVSEEDPDYASNNDIKWNFTKFLVGRNGKVLKRYEPSEDLEVIRKDIESLLDI